MAGVTLDEFEEFVRENQDKFYRLAYSYLKNEQEALDTVQNAILRGLQKLKTLRQPMYLRTWFYRMLINESLGVLRKRKTKPLHLPLEDSLIGAPSETELPERDMLLALIRNLEPELQTIVFLRFYEEMKLGEIARTIGVNLNTVKTRLYRALKLLKVEILEEN